MHPSPCPLPRGRGFMFSLSPLGERVRARGEPHDRAGADFRGAPDRRDVRAPGAFTFCLSEGLIMQTGLIHGTGMSYLGGEIKVVAPVLMGDTVRVRIVIAEKRETKKPDRGIVTYRHEVLNQRGELVLEAVIKRMIRRAAARTA